MGLGEVVPAIAGPRVEVLKDYPYSNGERAFSGTRELAGRRMVAPGGVPAVPLMYGVRARKG